MIKLKQILEYGETLKALHKASSTKEIEALKKDIRKDSGWSNSDIDYMLRKYRKDIKYKGPDIYQPPPKTVPVKKIQWNDSKYKKWIKDSASGGGKYHSYDMAQNAKMEHGLLDFVKKKIRREYGDETPLERIQWDIEAHI